MGSAHVFILEVHRLKFHYQPRAGIRLVPKDSRGTFGSLVVLVSHVRDILQESMIILARVLLFIYLLLITYGS